MRDEVKEDALRLLPEMDERQAKGPPDPGRTNRRHGSPSPSKPAP